MKRNPVTIYLQVVCLACILSLLACKPVAHVAYAEPGNYQMDSLYRQGADDIVNLIAPYKAELEKEMNEVIATCAKDLHKARPEGALGNWLADLIHLKAAEKFKTTIDFAIYNYGGIRLPMLPAGPVTKGKFFELMPFENNLVILDLDYPTFLKLVKLMAANGGWPASKALRYEIENGQPVHIMLNGKAPASSESFKVAMSDYIANGGDQCFFLQNLPRADHAFLIRDLILEYARELSAEGKMIDAQIEGRIIKREN